MAPAGPELAGSCCDTVGIGDCNPARRRRAPDGDPLYNCKSAEISLSPAALPFYVLRTVVRMLAALILSLIFTFTYATLAGKSRRAETVLIPLLDVLQSVPILGYLSFTVVFFISLFPQHAPRRAGRHRPLAITTSCFRLPRRCTSWNLPNSRKAPSN